MSRVCRIDYLKPKVHILDFFFLLFFSGFAPPKMHLAIKILPLFSFWYLFNIVSNKDLKKWSYFNE